MLHVQSSRHAGCCPDTTQHAFATANHSSISSLFPRRGCAKAHAPARPAPGGPAPPSTAAAPLRRGQTRRHPPARGSPTHQASAVPAVPQQARVPQQELPPGGQASAVGQGSERVLPPAPAQAEGLGWQQGLGRPRVLALQLGLQPGRVLERQRQAQRGSAGWRAHRRRHLLPLLRQLLKLQAHRERVWRPAASSRQPAGPAGSAGCPPVRAAA